MNRAMHKSTLTLLLTAALGAVSPVMAQSATTLPASSAASIDTRLTTSRVTIEIGRYAGPLSSLLAAIAKSAGYELILEANVDALAGTQATPATTPATGTSTGTAPSATTSPSVVYNFANKPFNEVWPLLMDLYGLSYDVQTIGGQPVLRVTSNPIQRVIKLNNARAAQVVNQIKLFFGTPVYSENPQKDASGNVVSVNRTLTDVKLDSSTLRIIADERTNSLIVRGTNAELNQVQRLAQEMDRDPNSASTSASAGTVRVQDVYSVQGNPADALSVISSQFPSVTATQVGSSRQLVLNGTRSQIDTAISLLKRVDQPAQNGPVIVQRVFQLINASSDEIKTTLDGTLKTETTATATLPNVPVTATDVSGNPTTVVVPNTTTTTTQTGSAVQTSNSVSSATTSNGATIISDKRTNTLIVRGTQTQVDQIAALIPQLDQVVPQINVQVRIQEINETATRSLGVDWTAGVGSFTAKLVTGSLTALFDPTTVLSGLNLGATLSALETQGLTKRVYDGNITMQSGQRSLGATGGTQNSSSSAAASIKSGGRLELNIVSTSGNITKQIDYGVNLDFFNPQVAPDGTITLQVRGQVNQPASAITGSTLPSLLNFTNSEATTTITFKSGQTVLLSGLLGNTVSNTNTGLPFLTSIPVIGSLFGNQSSSTSKSQLLVVITGTVVK